MFGEKIKALRETIGISQREVGAHIEVDSAFMSKVEKGEKTMSRSHLKKLSEVLKISEEELQKLWLADKVYKVIEEEDLGHDALMLAEKKVEYVKTKNHEKS